MAAACNLTFCVVGRDARQLAAARALQNSGYTVLGAEGAGQADYILLPMPMDAEAADLARILRAARPGTLALGGRISEPVRKAAQAAGVELVDYFLRPELACLNAVPTAEGCLALLMQLRQRTIWESEFLVLGYGRIGRAVARRLQALGGQVTIAARAPEQRAAARCAGLHAAPLTALEQLLPHFDAVINTIPAPVLGAAQLRCLPRGGADPGPCQPPRRNGFCRRAGTGPACGTCLEPARPLCARNRRCAGGAYRGSYFTGACRHGPQRKGSELMNSSLEPPRTVVFALCGSFCTFETVLPQIIRLRACGWEVLPMLSYAASALDTRFGHAADWKQRLEEATGHRPLEDLREAEPLGPKHMAQALVIAPCTGTTMALLAAGISATPVTLAAKSMLRGGRPVVIGVSTNDGLSGSVGALAALLQRKNYYFIPFGQDDSYKKPCSLKADFTQLPDTLEAALRGVQLQPILL